MITETTVSKILDAFDDCAPSPTSKDALRQALAEAKTIAHETPRVLVLMVAQAIVDGLGHGNWRS